MARRDLSTTDISEHAAADLDYLIKARHSGGDTPLPTVTAEEAWRESRIVEYSSTRAAVRVLFITANSDLINPTEQTLDGYINVADVFDELHILVLRQGLQPKQPVFRPHKNVFIYTVAAKYWWQLPKVGLKMLRKELEFVSGFRPDLVVAHDPYESALVALKIASLHNRPTQLHILKKDFYPKISDVFKPALWRRIVSWYTVPRFASIRVATQKILYRVQETQNIPDLQKLPALNPYHAIVSDKNTLDLKKQYPQYVFFLLFVGSLQDPSAALTAIEAVKQMLGNRRVCLILCGEGAGEKECWARAKALGIASQLIIKREVSAQTQYLKAANILIVTSADDESEQVVLQGAAAGIPMVMTKTEAREELFDHQESAMLAEKDQPVEITLQVKELMDDVEGRKRMAEQASLVIERKLFQDPYSYQKKYRATVEEALFIFDKEHTATE